MSASAQSIVRRPAVSALALICAAQFVLQLDFSIVNVALPTMKRTSPDERDYGPGQVMRTRPAWPRGAASHAKREGSGRPGAVLPGEK